MVKNAHLNFAERLAARQNGDDYYRALIPCAKGHREFETFTNRCMTCATHGKDQPIERQYIYAPIVPTVIATELGFVLHRVRGEEYAPCGHFQPPRYTFLENGCALCNKHSALIYHPEQSFRPGYVRDALERHARWLVDPDAFGSEVFFLAGKRLNNVDFRNCDLRRANFRCQVLYGCDFTGAKLAGANFYKAKLDAPWKYLNNIDRANLNRYGTPFEHSPSYPRYY